MRIAVLGVDLGKNSCSLVGLDEAGRIVLRRRMRRETVIAFAGKLPTCVVAMEACCGAHHIGLVVGFIFVVARNFRSAITFVCDEGDCLIRARRNLYFIHKYELQKELNRVPDNANLLIDLSSTSYVDLDNVDVINAFIKGAAYRNIAVIVRGDIAERSAPLINAPTSEVRFS
ncbi:hypothetical protein M529_20175 [Sphingobium ummariense RL-3]|uniref:Uncharacterized protein n=1 Tax=Sphingobium ummariense RL-3 TaxID=1346791 RepID=T0J0N3_9SPHN|nr:hypothetical protein M529_20175 [Sphingobium ummariense RL-3]